MRAGFQPLRGLALPALVDVLRHGRLSIQTGPLIFRVQTSLRDVAVSIHALYADFPCAIDAEFSDYWISVRLPTNLRRWFRRQAEFVMDGELPFEALPRDQAPALFEWGMNWTIAASSHQWFTIHAAVIEAGGAAAILPAPPGSGKSTLCAALVLRGWRLLSDELTLLDPDSLAAHGLARPINIKNQSIDIIRAFAPTALWAPEVYDTKKGRVTHLAPPAESVMRMDEPASPRWIIFPRFVPDAAAELTPRSKSQTFIDLARNSFNYGTLGEAGFRVIAALLDRCDCYDFTYSKLDDAIEAFDYLAAEAGKSAVAVSTRRMMPA